MKVKVLVAKSCPTLCDPMNRSTPGLPVHHHLLELTQTHVHRVRDATQPSHPVVPFSSCPQSLPASESFPMSQFFASGGQSTAVSALASFPPKKSQGWSPCSPRDPQESSPTPQFKRINSSALSFLHSPTLTSILEGLKPTPPVDTEGNYYISTIFLQLQSLLHTPSSAHFELWEWTLSWTQQSSGPIMTFRKLKQILPEVCAHCVCVANSLWPHGL